MLRLVHECNERLTDDQYASIQELITQNQTNIETLKGMIHKARTEIDANATAIKQLEPTIARIEDTISRYSDMIAQVKKMKEDIGLLGATPRPDLSKKSPSKFSCEDSDSELQNSLALVGKHFDDALATLMAHTKSLVGKLDAHKLQMYTHRIKLKAVTQQYSSGDTHKKALEEALLGLRRGVRAIKRIPVEVWAQIFHIRVSEDSAEYLLRGSSLTPRVAFSQVCRLWRRIALSERRLWSLQAPPDTKWTNTRVQLFHWLLNRAPRIPTLNINLTSSTYDRNGVTTEIKQTTFRLLESYNLDLVASGNGRDMKAGVLPGCTVANLTITFRTSPSSPWITSILRGVGSFPTLTLACNAHCPHGVILSLPSQAQPSSLRIILSTFSYLKLENCLPSSLQELHLEHNGVDHTQLSADISLPCLKKLGITPPDIEFMGRIKTGPLEKIILYGPKERTLVVPNLAQDTLLSKMSVASELEFRSWSQYASASQVGSNWSVDSVLQTVTDGLVNGRGMSLAFLDSHVDGARLASLLSTWKAQPGSRLESVKISCCSGITRTHCEEISRTVGQLEVYV